MVRANSRSVVLLLGSEEDIATAADTPQMATDPPINTPNCEDNPSQRASREPAKIVNIKQDNTIAGTIHPISEIIPKSTLNPNKATPVSSKGRAHQLTPDCIASESYKGRNASPINTANNITGAEYRSEIAMAAMPNNMLRKMPE